MTPTIVRTIPRADPSHISRLGACGVATVHEAQERTGLLRPYMPPIYREARVAGSAVTVLCGPGDNLMIHAAIAVVQPGDVIVGDADGVVVPRETAAVVVAAADERLQKEARTRERLKAGELGLDLYGLREALAQRGVVWRD